MSERVTNESGQPLAAKSPAGAEHPVAAKQPVGTALDRTRPPLLGDPPELHSPPVQRYTLSNGLRVLIVEQRGLPIVDVHLIVRGGAAIDDPPRAGLTSLAVDMLDEGAGMRSALEIAEAIEDLGASLSASASWDDVGFGIHVHTSRLQPALDILADIIIRPAIPQADFDRRKQQRLASILQDREEPRVLASQAFNAVVFGADHPYGAPLHGTRSTIEKLQREDAVAYHQKYVRPGNAFMVAVGDVRALELVTMLETAFGQWPNAPVEARRLQAPPPPPPTAIHVVDRPGSGQSELRVGTLGVRRTTPDYFPLLVLNTVLGGSFTSRLNLNLRQDKGYTYGAGSSFGFRLAEGPFVASSAVDTAVTDDAVRQILLEIGRLREELVPAAELTRAQSYIALGLPRSFETTADVASHIAEIELYGLGDSYFDAYVPQVRAVTAEDVRRVARQYLDPAAMSIVIAGDHAAIEAPLAALGAGPVHRRPLEE
jgi:zinc protease